MFINDEQRLNLLEMLNNLKKIKSSITIEHKEIHSITAAIDSLETAINKEKWDNEP